MPVRRSFSEVGKSWEHSLRQAQGRQGFNVHIGDSIAPTETKRQLFAARYLKKSPISNERLTIVEGGITTVIEYAAYKDGVRSVRKFTPLSFLAELQQHVFDTFEQNTRWFGAYSCRSRGAARADEATSDSVMLALPEPATKSSASWARCTCPAVALAEEDEEGF